MHFEPEKEKEKKEDNGTASIQEEKKIVYNVENPSEAQLENAAHANVSRERKGDRGVNRWIDYRRRRTMELVLMCMPSSPMNLLYQIHCEYSTPFLSTIDFINHCSLSYAAYAQTKMVNHLGAKNARSNVIIVQTQYSNPTPPRILNIQPIGKRREED